MGHYIALYTSSSNLLTVYILTYITSCYTVMQVFSEKSYIMITARDIIEKTRTFEFTACPYDRLTLQCVVYSMHVACRIVLVYI